MNQRQSSPGSVWNVVAVVATLALSAAVAIVAVTRSGPAIFKAIPTTSPSASPSASPSPGGLEGDGPFVIYAAGGAVFGYDVASDATKRLGDLDGAPATERSRQPGTGRVVAFPTESGSVWSITRIGMERAGVIPAADGDRFEGAVLSPDDHKLAVAALAPEPATLIVDLDTGRTTANRRSGLHGAYPRDPLLPVAWSLGGGLLYQVPFCECDAAAAGLYTLEISKGASALVAGTRSTRFYRFVVSNSAQALYYGAGTSRRCRSNEADPCEGPPYTLRRIAAGQRGIETLERASDASFVPLAISQDGGLLLVQRTVPGTGATRVEMYNAEGIRVPPIRGIPRSSVPLAFLPRDVVVVATHGNEASLAVVRNGRTRTVVSQGPAEDTPPVYLGWLV